MVDCNNSTSEFIILNTNNMVVEWETTVIEGNIIFSSNIARLRLKKWNILNKGLGLEIIYRKYRDNPDSPETHVFMINIEWIQVFSAKISKNFDSIPSMAKRLYFKEVDFNIKYGK